MRRFGNGQGIDVYNGAIEPNDRVASGYIRGVQDQAVTGCTKRY